MSSTEARLRELEQEVRRLRAEVAKRPLRAKGGGAATALSYLRIIDGQTVYSSGAVTYYGINKFGGALATVPSIYDPNGVGSTAGLFTATTGIGRAVLYTNGIAQSSLVLVAFDSASPISSGPLLELDFAVSTTTKSIPLSGDPTQSITAYVPLFI